VKEDLLVNDVGGDDRRREEQKREHRFPDVDAIRRRQRDDDVEPQVGEDTPGSRDEEHPQVLDSSHFAVWYDEDAQSGDDEQVEGGAADNRAWTEIAGFETVADHLDDGQEYFGSRRPERHERQIRDSLVPDAHVHDDRLAIWSGSLKRNVSIYIYENVDNIILRR